MRINTLLKSFIALLTFLSIFNIALANEDDYTETLNNFKKTGTGKAFAASAYAYAVFPTIGKGGLIVGAAHGDGQLYRQGTLTGKVSMTQLSIGLQLGGQAYSQIVFLQDKRAYDEFTSGNFEFGADASAIAINARVSASASTTGTSAGKSVHPSDSSQASSISYFKGMAVLTVGKGGFMYEASVGGQKYKFRPL